MNLLDTTQLVAMAAALGWASGLRLYAVLFATGMAGVMQWIPLPKGLALLQHPVVLSASGFMLFIEFFADKIPGLDSLWDTVHTVIRIPAGAALAGAVFGFSDSEPIALAAAIIGGTLAATSHASKATTRAAINTSPEPFSNIAMSLVEDGLVAAGLWLAYEHPLIFLGALAVFTVLAVWLIRVMWKFVTRLARKLVSIFSGGTVQDVQPKAVNTATGKSAAKPPPKAPQPQAPAVSLSPSPSGPRPMAATLGDDFTRKNTS